VPVHGICLRVTHTGLAGISILITDIEDATDQKPDLVKAGPVYVPIRKSVELVYTSAVARSFEAGAIRKFIEIGHLEAEFFFGPLTQRGATGTVFLTESPYTAGPDDRYILWCPTTPGPLTLTLPKVTEHHTGKLQVVDATGIASTHTITILPDPTLPDTIGGGASDTITTNFGFVEYVHDCVSDWTDISAGGGGGVTDHTALTSLPWASSGHTGTADTFAGFDGGGAATYLTAGGSAQLLWGDNTVGSTTTTRYLTPGYDDGLAETIPTQIRAIRAGTVQNMRVRHNTPGGNGNSIVYTLRVNGVASALSVTLASTASDNSDLASTVAVAAGDLLDIEVTKAAVVGAGGPNNVALTVEFV